MLSSATDALPDQIAATLGIRLEQSLAAALEEVARAFDERAICSKRIDSSEVLRYYRQCDRVYLRYHSHQGALHVGLVPPGVNQPYQHGHTRHAGLFGELVERLGGLRAIEFGCGNGYNLRLLARQYPEREWAGVDLSEAHIRAARELTSEYQNVHLQVANYLQLEQIAGSYDAVLAIETLCQCESQAAALREAFRLLRPGGRMMVFDCFRGRALAKVSPALAKAAILVEKTAAVDEFAPIDDWRQLARSVGFVEIEVVDRSAETAHDLSRLYRMARRYFRLPAAVRMLSRRVAPRAMQNVVCGLLMPHTVGAGVHCYFSVVLEKPA
jgi:arsenite methyltransferase